MNLVTDLEINITQLKESFRGCADIISRKFPVGNECQSNAFIMYVDGLVARSIVEESILNNLLVRTKNVDFKDGVSQTMFEFVRDNGFGTADIREAEKLEDIKIALMSGDTAFLLDGCNKAIIASTRGWPNRGVPKTDTEMVLQGSKEAFSEALRINTVLIRRRIRDEKLRIEQQRVGKRSQTDIAIVYLDDVARISVVAEVKQKLDSIRESNLDAIIDSGYIEQFFKKGIKSIFPLAQMTERPDKAASAVLEGRIVIICDNSPFVIIVPATVSTFFQSSEDYYSGWQIMSFMRLIRYGAAVLAMLMPGFYLAVTVFHPDMIPTPLALKLASARLNIPFPIVVEILIMELAFELLREAGVRLPATIGGTIGIVGGLIVGQAAVEAGIVSPIVVIVVAVTAISSFAVPNISLVAAFRLIKFFVIALSATLGLFGFCMSVIFLVTHLCSLKSFHFPYMFPFTSGDVNHYSDIKDTLLRLPLFYMKKRPIFADPANSTRMSDKKKEAK